jgi:hypothetical protein
VSLLHRRLRIQTIKFVYWQDEDAFLGYLLEFTMATMKQVRDAMHAVPFEPFILHLVDGREFRVKHSDFVAVANGREMVFVGDDEGIHHLALPLVLDVEIPPPSQPASAETPVEKHET